MRSLRSRAARRLLLPLALAASTACAVGPTPRTFEPATGGAGTTLDLWFDRRDHRTVELLAVPDDSTLVVRAGATLLRVRWPAVRLMRSRALGIELFGQAPLHPHHARRLRLSSRYPQGITPEIERALLAAYGQSAIGEVR